MIEKIYIPTLGRVEEQKTYNDLPDKYKERVVMVVQEHERPKYKYDVEYLIVGDNIGSSKTRELIFKDGCKRKINFLMVDDQMIIKRRVLNYKELGLPSSWILEEKDYDDMFELMNSWLNEGYIHCGTRKQNIPPMREEYIDIAALFSVSFVNGTLLSEIIDDIQISIERESEDITFIIEYLTRGYKNRQSNLFIHNKKTHKAGGCTQAGRTLNTTSEIHQRLVKRYPNYIFLNNTKQQEGLSTLKVKWKQAYKDSQVKSLWEI